MMTLVLSFLRTFSSAAEKNSALSPSLIRPSTYRTVKLSVCFFSTIKANPPAVQADASKSEAMGRAHREHAIHAAEAERIGKKELHARLARGVRDIVQIAQRIGGVEVDRRRNEAVAQRDQRAGQLDRAARSHRLA